MKKVVKLAEQISYRDLFNKFLKINMGNAEKAASEVLDVATDGAFAGVEEPTRSKMLKQVIDKFSVPQGQAMEKALAKNKMQIRLSKGQWEEIGKKYGWLKAVKTAESEWPETLKKGRFTEYCKRNGFKGPCKECAEKAMKSDDASVRGMASFYLNTIKPSRYATEIELIPRECVLVEKVSSLQNKEDFYTYHINLNERGSFFADVRDSSGKTVFEIKAGDELAKNDASIFEDGFMKNIHDMYGLKEYLVSLGIMKPNQELKDMQPRER
jgi:hypothetical protein